MYEKYFGLIERPFSIAPDPQYLYMSKRHKEAMAHLSYGLTQGGCFIVLTGEVGTGKTTLCRNLLGELPSYVDVALILNANINEFELLQSICDELKIHYSENASQKQLLDAINEHLLATFADNRHTVLIIDEAQLLSRDVLEQIRLLTNLETTKSKLLQIILIGQPELNDLLARNDLRQLAQRVTARYHLGALAQNDIEDYVNFRLSVAGCKQPVFSRQALNKLHALTDGIPRKINVLADHALLAAYAESSSLVDAKTVKTAAADVFVQGAPSSAVNLLSRPMLPWALIGLILLMINIGLWWWFTGGEERSSVVKPAAESVSSSIAQDSVAVNADEEISETSVSELNMSDTPLKKLSEESLTETEVSATNLTQGDSGELRPSVGQVVIAETPLDTSDTIPNELRQEFVSLETNAQSKTAPQVSVKTPSPDSIPAPSPVPAQRAASAGVSVSNQESPFASLLATSADRTSRIFAFQNLAELWGADLPSPLLAPACDALKSQGLYCLGFDKWEQWLRYNRAAILVVEYAKQLHRVVVDQISTDTARVRIGQESLQVPIAELRQRWAKQGVLFWRPNELGTPLLQEGDSGVAVTNARRLLNRALLAAKLPLLDSAEGDQFELDMAQKIFALQTRFEIINDGKIGNETWLLLNELTNNQQRPQLRTRR